MSKNYSTKQFSINLIYRKEWDKTITYKLIRDNIDGSIRARVNGVGLCENLSWRILPKRDMLPVINRKNIAETRLSEYTIAKQTTR